MQQQATAEKVPIKFKDIQPGMVLEYNIRSGDGYRLLTRSRTSEYITVLHTHQLLADGGLQEILIPWMGTLYPYNLERPTDLVEVKDGLTPLQRYGQLDNAARVSLSRVAATVGSDPEIFIEAQDGSCMPAFAFLGPKTKDPEVGYWDGFQAEFSTKPSHCIAYHCDSVRHGLFNLTSRLPKGTKLSLKNVMWIPEETRFSVAEEHVQFGCNPSKSAYDEPWMQYDGRTVPFRTAGGHIHLATRGHGFIDNVEIAKNLDRFLGVIGVSMFRYWDVPERRELYGKAGEYRDTPYGIEYRTLSNAWLHSPWLMHFTFELARYGIGLCANWEATEDEVRRCINTCDKDMAVNILSRNMKTLQAILHRLPNGGQKFVKWMEEVIMEGAHTKMVDPDTLSSFWKLGAGAEKWVNHSENPGTGLYRVYEHLAANGFDKKLP